MKKTVTIILCFVIFFTLCISANVKVKAENVPVPPTEVLKIAESSISNIKSKFKSAFLKWGYKSEEEVDSLVLGKCYQMYFIGECAKNASGNSLDELIDNSAKEVWVFTLESDGVPMGELKISCRNDEYYLMGYSGKDTCFIDAYLFAKELAAKKSLCLTNKLISAGPNYYFILEGEDTLIVPVVYSGENFVADVKTLTDVVRKNIYDYYDIMKSTTEPLYGGDSLTDKLRQAVDTPQNTKTTDIFILVIIPSVLLIGTILIVKKVKAKENLKYR